MQVIWVHRQQATWAQPMRLVGTSRLVKGGHLATGLGWDVGLESLLSAEVSAVCFMTLELDRQEGD